MIDGDYENFNLIKERQANQFAFELLMPESEVRSDIVKSNIDLMLYPNPKITEMDDKYGVEPLIMLLRLSQLYWK